MNRKYSEDRISLVKPFKGRNKYDIYIHDQGFRETIKDLSIEVPDEYLAGMRPLKKKMLAKTFEYALLLQQIVFYIYSQHKKNKAATEIQKSLHTVIQKACKECKLETTYGTESFAEELLRAYELIEYNLKKSHD